jgi:hypothetical protein
MKNHIDNEHGAMVFKYKNHRIEEVESTGLGFGCEKNKKHKGVAPFTITKYFGN